MRFTRATAWRCRAALLGLAIVSLPAVASNDRSLLDVEQRIELAKSEPVAAEAALMARLDATRVAKPDQSDRVWLQLLVGYQSKATVAGEHGAGELEALYPIANAAQGMLNRLDRDLVTQQASSLIERPNQFLDGLVASGGQSAGFRDAALAATAAQRKALRAASGGRLSQTRIASLAGDLALHDGVDAPLLRSALAHADPVSALHWLRRAEQAYGSKVALTIYQAAEARVDVYSAAQLHAAGNEYLGQSQRNRWLLQLSDPRTGGSAALALAKSMNPDLANVLAAKARSTGNPLERKRLLLALRQSAFKSGGAVSALRSDSAFLAKLDEETRAWFVN